MNEGFFWGKNEFILNIILKGVILYKSSSFLLNKRIDS